MSNDTINHHVFTATIIEILESYFSENAIDIFEASPLLGYLNNKTKSVNSGSKARGAFANHYALYVIIEDYITKGFFDKSAGYPYSKYEGAKFTDLFRRQRELPFGSKLQNHALNSRLNDEFKKFYPTLNKIPIIRDLEKQRYWIQEDFLKVKIKQQNGSEIIYNIAQAVIDIIDAYTATKKLAFESFINTCQKINQLDIENAEQAITFIIEQLNPNVDARIFEIVSYAILKAQYGQQTIWLGKTKESVVEEQLILYKTGRTNANDGGIDFVMRPLGRFFQVTETVDVNKYFLDIDKVQRFPITFVIKTDQTAKEIFKILRQQAFAKYKIETVVESYIAAIEEIINTQNLIQSFRNLLAIGKLPEIMDEIIRQSKVEFNYSDG
jgi:hypothetical protein